MVYLISHHDVSQKKMTTYSDRTSAVALQDRFINEARVDVVGRVMNVLEKATGLPVRMAQEGERKYFAGLLRVVDNTVQIHADFAPHVRPRLSLETPLFVSKTDSLELRGLPKLGDWAYRCANHVEYPARHCPGRGNHHLRPTVAGGG